MRRTIRFSGTLAEVTQAFDEWKAAHPDAPIAHRGAPMAHTLDPEAPEWEMFVDYVDES